uniref:Uncharacterized protein n=1 Tax=Ditylenchus dipsaci TaxID=166011 RepID=A0A915EC56_9BILA
MLSLTTRLSTNSLFAKPIVLLIYTFLLIGIRTQIPMNIVIAESATERESASTSQCVLKEAEKCFDKLFEQMPICPMDTSTSAAAETDHNQQQPPQLTFRCQHFNATIGQTARTSYRRVLLECSRNRQQQTTSSGQQVTKHRNNRRKAAPTISDRSHPPSEIQFISLFGYLQTQCRKSPTYHSHSQQQQHTNSPKSVNHYYSSLDAAEGTVYSPGVRPQNCSGQEFQELIESCEIELTQKDQPTHSDLERHKLLKIKLDASGKLLHYRETNRIDECLMIRAMLSDIFLIHQKYCFQTTVTKCLCDRLNLETFCGIVCAHLEPHGLPLQQSLNWSDFRGRLTGGHQINRFSINMILVLSTVCLITCLFGSL